MVDTSPATAGNIRNLTVRNLLASYSAIIDELRRREIVRSSNSPLGDYAERFFCRRIQVGP